MLDFWPWLSWSCSHPSHPVASSLHTTPHQTQCFSQRQLLVHKHSSPFSLQKHGFSQIKLLCTNCRSTPLLFQTQRHTKIQRFGGAVVQDRQEERNGSISPHGKREKLRRKWKQAEHQILSLGDPKKKLRPVQKRFLGKRALIRHISRKTKLNSPYLLYSRFLYGASRLRGLENYLLFSLISSQIWLNPSFG